MSPNASMAKAAIVRPRRYVRGLSARQLESLGQRWVAKAAVDMETAARLAAAARRRRFLAAAASVSAAPLLTPPPRAPHTPPRAHAAAVADAALPVANAVAVAPALGNPAACPMSTP